MINDTAVSINSTVADGVATLKAEGNGSDGDGVEISTGDNVTLSSAGKNKISISANDTTYDLTSAADSTAITLEGSDNSSKEVLFEAGKDISVTGADAGKIAIAHKTTETTPTTVTETPAGGENVTMIDSVTVDNGHITGYRTKTITLPVGAINSSATLDVTGGSVEFSVTDSDNKSVTGTAENVLYYTINGTKVYNQGSFDFYTKSEIDGKINGINAMVYKGTVGGEGATSVGLPVANVSIGDTYMVKDAGTYAGVAADVGDLFIATGTEENNIITDETLAWTYVPAGDDTDTQYTLTLANNTITLSNNVDSGVNNIELEPGQDIVITTKEDNSGVTFAHKTYADPAVTAETAETPAFGEDITIVSGVETSNGHITGVKTKKITLPSPSTYTIPVTEGTAGSTAAVTLTGSDGSTDQVVFEAGTDIKVNVGTDENNDHIIVAHKAYNYTAPETTEGGVLTPEGKLKVVTGATVENGHVKALTTTEYTLPSDTSYTPSIVVAKNATANAIDVTSTLTDNNNAAQEITFKVSSTNLKINSVGDNGFSIDYEWGTF